MSPNHKGHLSSTEHTPLERSTDFSCLAMLTCSWFHPPKHDERLLRSQAGSHFLSPLSKIMRLAKIFQTVLYFMTLLWYAVQSWKRVWACCVPCYAWLSWHLRRGSWALVPAPSASGSVCQQCWFKPTRVRVLGLSPGWPKTKDMETHFHLLKLANEVEGHDRDVKKRFKTLKRQL